MRRVDMYSLTAQEGGPPLRLDGCHEVPRPPGDANLSTARLAAAHDQSGGPGLDATAHQAAHKPSSKRPVADAWPAPGLAASISRLGTESALHLR